MGELCQIPMRNAGLVTIGVATISVYRAKYGCGVVAVHKGAGAVVDGFPAEQHIVGVHNAVNKADGLPLGDECGLALNDFIKHGQNRIAGLSRSGKVAIY